MIQFQNFLSGSTGNCTFITDGKTKILVDCGANGRYITDCLERIGVPPYEINAILISHSHRDHSQGAGILSRRFDIPMMASEDAWEEMLQIVGRVSARNTKVIKSGDTIELGDMLIKPFSVPHDAFGTLGYRFESEDSKMAIATDMGHISKEVIKSLTGCELVIVEANHDIEMLKNGSYPPYLKRRILSEKGHLSNDDSAKLCTMLAQTGTKSFWLGHLSEENNTPDLAYFAVKSALTDAGIKVGTDVELNVLPAFWIG